MNLEELKTAWEEISLNLEKQNKMTSAMIVDLTVTRHKNKLRSVQGPETIGGIICLAAALFILLHFDNLGNWYLQVCGIVSVIVLALLGLISMKSIRYLNSFNISNSSFKQALTSYSTGKLKFLSAQKMNFYLGALLIVCLLPVSGALISGKDFFTSGSLWLWYATLFPFFYGFSRWVFRNYKITVAEAENILRELDV